MQKSTTFTIFRVKKCYFHYGFALKKCHFHYDMQKNIYITQQTLFNYYFHDLSNYSIKTFFNFVSI
jgi:hypothetical protein